MRKNYILKKIDELRPWYQNIKLDDIKTTKKKTSGIELWKVIKTVLPKDLTNKKVLDLGANAGYYSIQCAIMRASVTSFEISDIAYSQYLFIKRYFQNIYGKLKIRYNRKNINDIDFKKLGHFDYVLAIAILYHLDTYKHDKNAVKTYDNMKRVIKQLTEISDNIIIRIRKGIKIEVYNEIFKKLNFRGKVINTIGDRTLILYHKI